MKLKKQYSRICPECKEIVMHSSHGSCYHSEKRNTKCRKCSDYNKDRANYGKMNGTWKGVGEISSVYFNQVKSNAKKRKIVFDITLTDMWSIFLKQNRKCAYTNLTLTPPTRTRNGWKGSASLDRIDSTKGYIKENVQWVHKDVNWMKQDFDQLYFLDLCNMISKNSFHVMNSIAQFRESQINI